MCLYPRVSLSMFQPSLMTKPVAQSPMTVSQISNKLWYIILLNKSKDIVAEFVVFQIPKRFVKQPKITFPLTDELM